MFLGELEQTLTYYALRFNPPTRETHSKKNHPLVPSAAVLQAGLLSLQELWARIVNTDVIAATRQDYT